MNDKGKLGGFDGSFNTIFDQGKRVMLLVAFFDFEFEVQNIQRCPSRFSKVQPRTGGRQAFML